jgi:tetratricopeptide (TPR) repeat protein/predicted Ser/Thr protein kinase
MTREKALQILGLAAGSDAAAIRTACERQGRVLAQRRAAAGTPEAVAACEAGLAAVHEAGQVLLGGAPGRAVPSPLSPTQQHDLPLRAPRRTATAAARPAAPPQPALAHSTPPLTSSHRDTPSAPPAAAELLPGTVLAERFEVRRRLGSGGMGVVYAAFDRARGEEVAVKLLLPHLLGDAAARQRFVAEAKIANSLAHPNIVRVYDLHEDAGRTFLTMELLHGRSLREEIHQRAQAAQRFTVEEVRHLGGQLCAALQEAHQQTVHRDVKPENIWLGEDGTVKLMDFGIARLLRPSQFTSTGLALGTAYYMAPEQLRGSKDIDHRADQYAVGVVLYELLTGNIPVGAVQAPHQVRKSIPGGLSRTVMRALAGKPEDRHADMAALHQALLCRASSRRLPAWAVTAAALLAVLGGAVAYWHWSEGLQPPPKRLTPDDPTAPQKFAEQMARVERLQTEVGGLDAAFAAQAGTARQHLEQQQKEPRDKPDALKRLKQAQQAAAVAARLAELWRQQTQRAGWSAQAKRHLETAEALAKRRAFDQAGAELTEGETLYRCSLQWRDNARPALEALHSVRAGLQEALTGMPDTPPMLAAWPGKLTTDIESQLVNDDGARALAQARQAADHLPQMRALLELRGQVSRAAWPASLAASLEDWRENLRTAEDRARGGDELLLQGQWAEARRGYEAAAQEYQDVARQLDRQLQSWIDKGIAALQGKQFDPALAQFQRVVALRPRGPRAAALIVDGKPLRFRSALIAALRGRALAQIGKGAFDLAIDDCTAIVQLDPKQAEAYRVRAEAHLAKRDWDRALADCQTAVEHAPKSALAYQTRARAYMGKRAHEEALAACDRALELDPQAAETYRVRAEVHLARGDYGRVIDDCTAALRFDRQLGPAYALRARAYYSQKEYTQAVKDCDEALRLDPKSISAYQVQVEAYQDLGEKDRAALISAEAARQIEPRSADEYYNRGWFFNRSRDYDKAIADLGKATQLDREHVEAYVEMATAYLDKKKPEEALRSCEKVLQLSPKHAIAYKWRGDAYREKKAYGRAIRSYDEAIRLNPKYAIGYNNRGLAYDNKKDYDRAIRDYDEAIRLDPKFSLAYSNRAGVYHRKGNYDRAIRDCDEAIRLDPKNALAYNNRGNAYNVKDDYDRAIRDYDEAIRLDPKFAMAYSNRGWAYYYKKDYDRALQESNEAIRLDPQYATAYSLRGSAYCIKEDYERAIQDCNEAIRLDPQFAAAYNNRGNVFHNIKEDYNRAIRDYSQAIRLDPECALYYKNRGNSYKAKGDTARARRDFDQYRRLTGRDP